MRPHTSHNMSDFKRRKLNVGKPAHNATQEKESSKQSSLPHTKPTSKPAPPLKHVAKPPPPQPEAEASDDDSEFGGFSEDEEDSRVKHTSNDHESSARSTSPDAESGSESGSDNPEDSESEPDPTPEVTQARSNGKQRAETAESEQPSVGADEVTKTFKDLGVREELCDACASMGFTKATPIQREAIPLALAGRDVIGLAETGSGKTAAFVLPILQALLDKPQPLFGLIMAPTRELAYQIAQQVDALGSIINVKSATLVGG